MDNYVLPKFSGLCGRKPLHEKIEEELQENKEWPVLSEAPNYESGVGMYDSGTEISSTLLTYKAGIFIRENYRSGPHFIYFSMFSPLHPILHLN